MLARQRRRWLPAISIVLPLAAVPSALAQPSSSIAGRVTDSVTRRPVAGVTMSLFDYGAPVTTVTDARGRYRFDRVRPGEHLVTAVTSAGYLGELSDGRLCYSGLTFHERFGFRCDSPLSDPPWLTVSAGETLEVPFALDRGGAIAGRVTAAADGEPVAGARIAITVPAGAAVAEAVTGADGGYRSGPLPAGGYRVFTDTGGRLAEEVWDGVHCDGRSPFGLCDPRRGTPVVVRLRRATGGIDFELERLGAITGRITDAATGAPLAGVGVHASRDETSSWTGTSGADGGYEVAGLLAGEYRVYTFDAAEHVGELFDGVPCPDFLCDAAAGSAVAVAVDQVTAGVDFALDRGAAISGTVAKEGGGPLGGVQVRLRDPAGGLDRVAQTDGLGRFRFAALPAGAYRVHTNGALVLGASDEAYDGVACGLDAFECAVDATPVPVVLGEERVIGFGLEPPGAVAGSVRDLATGEPIRGLDLVIRDLRGGVELARTGGDGRYLADGLPRGVYTVETEGWAEPFEHVDQMYDRIPCFLGRCEPAAGTPVAVLSDAVTGGIDFDLPIGAAIVGRVTREGSGEPVELTYVWAVDALGRPAGRAPAESDGRYRLRGLPDGDYYLTTTAPFAPFGMIDEVHAGIQCVHGTGLGCDPLEGDPVHAEAGAPPPAVDFALAEGFRPGTPCRPGGRRLCLAGGRFEVGVKRFDLTGPGLGFRRPISDSAGAFTFFAGDNLEAVVRVVDACDDFGHFWVLAASLGNLQTEAAVRDTLTGEARFYVNLDVWPTLDTAAFATCGAGAAPAPATVPVPAPTAAAAAPGSAGACVPGPSTLCLLGGRFAATAVWNDGAGGSGAAGAVALGDRSGYLWFHRPGSPEVAIKVLDACSLARPAHWVFASGLTTSEVHLTVTDTVSGEALEVVNPLGRAFVPVQELGFFDHCP